MNLRVVCVLKSGGDYRPEHVRVLREACARFLPPHDFKCLTDTPAEARCDTERLMTEARGWWAKLELFRVFHQGATLYLDLDTVLRGDAAGLLAAAQGRGFVALRDFYRGRTDAQALQSSLMYWEGDMRWIWEAWLTRGARDLRGDQDFLEQCFRERGMQPVWWQDIAPDLVCSFKANIRDAAVKSAAPVVCFHGRPRPWEQTLVPHALPPEGPIKPGAAVVVVGNGPSVKQQRLGRVVDAFDEVVRINAFEVDGHEAHTGRRTTLHATYGPARPGYVCERTLWLHGHAPRPCAQAWLVPKAFYWRQVEAWGTDRTLLPSAGLVTVAWLLETGVARVHVAGFDHFLKHRHAAHHYWDRHASRPPREHAPEREAAMFEQWRQAGRVSYL